MWVRRALAGRGGSYLTLPSCYLAVAPSLHWPQSYYVENLERMCAKIILSSKVPWLLSQGGCGSTVESGATELDISSEPEFKGQTWVPGLNSLPLVCQANSCPSPSLVVLSYKEEMGRWGHGLVDGGLAPQHGDLSLDLRHPCEQLGTHCALLTSVLWDLDPRSLMASWHSEDTAFWFSETSCLQAVSNKGRHAMSSDLHICTCRHVYAHAQMHAPYICTHQRVRRRNSR